MWVWRRLMEVKWTDKKTNEEVLNPVKEKKSLLSEIRKRKRRWIGHILRHEKMLRTVLEGGMKGKRPRGRKRIKMGDDIMTGTYTQMKRRAEDREEWQRDVMRDLPLGRLPLVMTIEASLASCEKVIATWLRYEK